MFWGSVLGDSISSGKARFLDLIDGLVTHEEFFPRSNWSNEGASNVSANESFFVCFCKSFICFSLIFLLSFKVFALSLHGLFLSSCKLLVCSSSLSSWSNFVLWHKIWHL